MSPAPLLGGALWSRPSLLGGGGVSPAPLLGGELLSPSREVQACRTLECAPAALVPLACCAPKPATSL